MSSIDGCAESNRWALRSRGKKSASSKTHRKSRRIPFGNFSKFTALGARKSTSTVSVKTSLKPKNYDHFNIKPCFVKLEEYYSNKEFQEYQNKKTKNTHNQGLEIEKPQTNVHIYKPKHVLGKSPSIKGKKNNKPIHANEKLYQNEETENTHNQGLEIEQPQKNVHIHKPKHVLGKSPSIKGKKMNKKNNKPSHTNEKLYQNEEPEKTHNQGLEIEKPQKNFHVHNPKHIIGKSPSIKGNKMNKEINKQTHNKIKLYQNKKYQKTYEDQRLEETNEKLTLRRSKRERIPVGWLSNYDIPEKFIKICGLDK